MTDHILNAELCAKCPIKKICLAIVPDGEWNPYIGKNPYPAILQKPRDDAPAALYHANQREKWHPCPTSANSARGAVNAYREVL